MQLATIILLACATLAVAQPDSAKAAKGTVERIKVHGKGLEGNLAGDSPDRDVSVYLPPGYNIHKKQRYPVVYMLLPLPATLRNGSTGCRPLSTRRSRPANRTK
jgi:hypothetical protein